MAPLSESLASVGAGARKRPWLTVAASAGAIALVALVVLRGAWLLALWPRGLALLQNLGPFAFFGAMALLPSVGGPLSAFSLAAGPAFGGRMGMGGVVAAGLAALAINLTLTYWLARRILRPVLTRWVVRLGYRVPQVPAADMTDLIVMTRVTPGPPFFLQNYLLGLAEAPFGRYFLISFAVQGFFTAAIILFGDALRQGRGRIAIVAFSLIVALLAAIHLVRRHYAARNKKAP